MHLVISGKSGRYEAVLLAVSKDHLRIARPGSVDAIELTLVDAVWVDENNQPVEFESFVTDGDICDSEWLARQFPLTRHARIS
jgi:hypothetical protein